MYVKVYGTIRVFKDEKAIVGTHIKKIEKFDEVTNHLLQVFVSNCVRKKGVLSNRDLQTHGMAKANNPSERASGVGMGGDAKQNVLSVMKEIAKNNKFIHKNDVFTVIQGKMSLGDFEKALSDLAEDGAIYSTYDNDIYSLTE